MIVPPQCVELILHGGERGDCPHPAVVNALQALRSRWNYPIVSVGCTCKPSGTGRLIRSFAVLHPDDLPMLVTELENAIDTNLDPLLALHPCFPDENHGWSHATLPLVLGLGEDVSHTAPAEGGTESVRVHLGGGWARATFSWNPPPRHPTNKPLEPKLQLAWCMGMRTALVELLGKMQAEELTNTWLESVPRDVVVIPKGEGATRGSRHPWEMFAGLKTPGRGPNNSPIRSVRRLTRPDDLAVHHVHPIRILVIMPRAPDDIENMADVAPVLYKQAKATGRPIVIDVLSPATVENMQDLCRASRDWEERKRRNPYHIVHFHGHATPTMLQFESPSGAKEWWPAAEVAEWLAELQPQLLVFTACDSGTDAERSIAEAMLPIAPELVAMLHVVYTHEAIRFTQGFYRELFAQDQPDVGEAIAVGRSRNQGRKEHWDNAPDSTTSVLPVHYQRGQAALPPRRRTDRWWMPECAPHAAFPACVRFPDLAGLEPALTFQLLRWITGGRTEAHVHGPTTVRATLELALAWLEQLGHVSTATFAVHADRIPPALCHRTPVAPIPYEWAERVKVYPADQPGEAVSRWFQGLGFKAQAVLVLVHEDGAELPTMPTGVGTERLRLLHLYPESTWRDSARLSLTPPPRSTGSP